MIGFTKLLCGTATISQALKNEGKKAPHLLQFSPHNQPVVVWNLTNRCNLKCRHCYLSAPVCRDSGTGREDRDYSRELTTAEAKAFIDDLVKVEVPILIYPSGPGGSEGRRGTVHPGETPGPWRLPLEKGETSMIGFTKLLCGTATISQALKNEGKKAPHLLQFSPG